MRSFLSFLLALSSWWTSVYQEPVAAPSPSAEGWQYLTKDTRGKDYYYLRSSRPYFTDVWFKTISEVTKETEISLVRFNCESGADRLIQISSFRGDVLLNSHVYKDSEWGYAYPETIGAAKLRAACGERKREWTFIGESDNNDSLFLKFDSLSKNGNLVRVWSQTLANEVRKSVTLYQFNCVENKIRSLQSTTYLGGEVNTSTGTSAWSYIVPNTVGEMLAKAACKSRRAEPRQKVPRR
jgi:surface-adhesin protein E